MGESPTTKPEGPPSDEVFLEMEGKTLRCNKKTLMEESDYFKAMFRGDFIERHKKTVKLNDVSFRAVEVILTLFWDERYVVHSDDVLLVLETACMLQFLRVKKICIDKILNEMNTRNCFEIWRVCEFLDIKPLHVKAKAKALSEFSAIAREDFICRLDLQFFCRYVANRNLECRNEFEVFQCCMQWFYENCAAEKQEILFLLLGCLNFNALSVHDLHEIKTYPDVLAHAPVAKTINCVIDIKENVVLRCDDAILSRARVFLESKKRIVQHCVCFMASLRTEKRLGIHDQFVVHFCDPKTDKIHLLFEVDSQKISRYMRGYRLIAYKELIFLIGGQHELGPREFVKNVWVYDLFKEKWERSTLLPYLRRDFEVCISGDNLFIIGGSGQYASVQNNLFWYNCSQNFWSEKVDLPMRGDDLKVCAHKNQLFLLSVSTARAYIFNPTRKVFTKIELCSEISEQMMEDFSLFSYRDEIFIKGRQLLRMKVETLHLKIVESFLLPFYIPSTRIFSVLSDDYLYTFYIDERNQCCTLEKFNVQTLHSTLIIDRHVFSTPLSVERRTYFLREIPNLFLLQHHGLVEEDEFVTDYFLNVSDDIFNKDL